jgi:hypothetical protein
VLVLLKLFDSLKNLNQETHAVAADKDLHVSIRVSFFFLNKKVR